MSIFLSCVKGAASIAPAEGLGDFAPLFVMQKGRCDKALNAISFDTQAPNSSHLWIVPDRRSSKCALHRDTYFEGKCIFIEVFIEAQRSSGFIEV